MNHARNKAETSFPVYSPTLWFSNNELNSKESNANNDVPVIIPSGEKILCNNEALRELLQKTHTVSK